MKDIYSEFVNDELWLIRENEWAKTLQKVRESQFTLGNGYMCSRGILEEVPYDSSPGTFVAGLYDKIASQVAELVNLPNPVNFKLTINNGEKVGLSAMDSLEHKRVLNMKKGVLVRRTLYKDSRRNKYDYQSLRFISMKDKNIGVMQIVFTPLDSGCSLDINTGIDTAVFNSGVLTEGRKKHFRLKELGQVDNAGFLVVETLEKKNPVVFWSGFYYEINGKKIYAKDNIFSLKLRKKQTVVFTKVFCIKRFPFHENHSSCKKESFIIFNSAFRKGVSSLLKNHVQSWSRLWDKADIVVGGTASIQQNIRFNIYHMLIAAGYDYGFSSVGARTLSGKGYRGHIFWDAEIFILPFYLLTFPQIAKNMLLYRYRRLDKARELAKSEGYRGVRFPWESAHTGDEETPEWAKDLDGSIIKIYTHKMEHHLVADIAYAVNQYYLYTSDDKFMEYCGYEMLFETARFWASRVKLNKRRNTYDITDVMGPDEFHVKVKNNAFTNFMAKWNLLTAHKFFSLLKENPFLYKSLAKKISLNDKEASQWKKVALRISPPRHKGKVIEQFDGYFRLKNINISRTDENGIPVLSSKAKSEDFGKTQLVKQADIVMLMYLLDGWFDDSTKKDNYNFYLSRTLHKSSLSPSIHSLMACETGDLIRAYTFFNVALRTDISDLSGNTDEGIHAACLGGTWQAIVFGFAGVKLAGGTMFIYPRMPFSWNSLKFSLIWRKAQVKLTLTNETVKIRIVSSLKKQVKFGVWGKIVSLKPGKEYIFDKKSALDKNKRRPQYL